MNDNKFPVLPRRWVVCGSVAIALMAPLGPSAGVGIAGGTAEVRPLDDFSPALVGPFRRLLEIEAEIDRHAASYDVDPILAKAVCLYESGANPGLTSSAGAQGYFQLMPATFREMKVRTNIEAGVKYLGQMVRRFGREDYALAAYNGGPTRVGRGGPMPLESLQYVLGVGMYRTVLKDYEVSLRAHARPLRLAVVQAGESWWGLSQRLGVPVVQLRLHNPFLAARTLRAGQQIVYPPEPRANLFDAAGRAAQYRVRLGDNALTLAFTLGIEPDTFRQTNGLWRLQTLLPGGLLTIPVDSSASFATHRAASGDDIGRIASRFGVDPWSIIRDNGLWDDQVAEGAILQIRAAAPTFRPAAPRAVQTHVVQRGDTLTAIARRYGTSVPAIQSTNALGRVSRIVPGQRLRIPAR